MRRSLAICLFLLLAGSLSAQPVSHFPKTGRAVNDYSAILSDAQRDTLEHRLRSFCDSTTNQIVVIITPTLYGEEIKALGTQIGHEWGVGQKDLDNGLIIIIKSKTAKEPDGEVAILTGYGLEGILPDAFCKYIIDEKMVPELADGHYYEALVAALEIIEPTCRGEYSYEELQKEDTRNALIGGGVLLTFIVIICLLDRKIRKDRSRGSEGGCYTSGIGTDYSGLDLSSSSSSSSSDSDYSYGGGDFGGGGASGRF